MAIFNSYVKLPEGTIESQLDMMDPQLDTPAEVSHMSLEYLGFASMLTSFTTMVPSQRYTWDIWSWI